MFESKGLFLVAAAAVDEDKLMEMALEAAPTTCNASARSSRSPATRPLYRDVAKALADAGIAPEASQITRIAKNTVDISDPETAQKVLKLMERLDDHDDVQNVAANFNIPDDVMKAIGEG